jgi:hypothetical protein
VRIPQEEVEKRNGEELRDRIGGDVPQRIRVRAAPGDATLAVEALEIADHVHSEIPPRRQ